MDCIFLKNKIRNITSLGHIIKYNNITRVESFIRYFCHIITSIIVQYFERNEVISIKK